ncbi:chromosome segregation protein SMC [Lentilactobacillus otakiensis]|uniref:Chromosome partition protein Smc n=1 Tax=Lentilactobacillus otakiensis DSM 19908 = JCM 15040 TaxID=1423780 RepID=S4NAS8_9LACO|nr:chromosome segregation protein SMC [Lentilactobacillus otakiensis]KRL09232.1 chromosome segregation protein SMC [Lentilactobacillus otakiensis DSM 19908 = JCM 15040]GAD15764.1 chromosome segregation protein SMC [Lentilactobacillus otakiensis DSM 19908 = JCM 15040]
MQLKSIEIVGFKSFADKTLINFPGGMTGIVGPNGSGKSNIAESIRWVMGEQSAKNLRGSRMPDVIFSGSADRRSLGMASVTLTLDNSDHFIQTPFDELKLSRKLFRNGDSSYYLNEKQCRLKDITDLFMDTGIGQGSLSIISQGNVEQIFNSKPEERRSIIENVAGVYKYKQHKNTAQKEIDETTDNLNRVEDIISELRGRMAPLEEQSSLATDYLDQKKRLDQFEKQQLILSTKQLMNDSNHVKQTVSEKSDLVNKIYAQVRKDENSRDQLKTKLTANRSTIDHLNDQLLEITERIQSLKSKHQLTAQEKSFKDADLKRISEQIKLTDKQIDDYKVKLSQSIDAGKRLAAKIDAKQDQFNQVAAKEKANSVSVIEGEIDKLRNQYVDLLQQKTTIKNRITMKSHDDRQLEERLGSQRQRIAKATDDLHQTQEQFSDKQTTLNETRSDLKDVAAKLADLAKLMNARKQAVDQSQANWLAALKIAEQAKAKAESLKNLHDSYRGFYRGVANLLKRKNELTGILGPVSDYLEINEKYVKAIETALGSQAQHIIVENNQAASAAIRLLTKERLGRVTLLPISTINGHQLNPNVIREAQAVPGFIGVAADLVTMPNNLSKIKAFLLGTTIIADKLDSAINISKQINHRTRIVTLDGQVVNAGGSLTGGANRNDNQGVLVQKNELEALNKSTAQMDQKLAENEKQLQNAKDELAKIEASHERGQQKVYQIQQKVSALENDCQTLRTAAQEKQRELKTLQLAIKNSSQTGESSDSSELADRQKTIEQQIQNTNDQLDDKRVQLANVKQSAEKFATQKQSLHEEIVVEEQKLSQLKVDQTAINTQITNHQHDRGQLVEQRTKLETELNHQVDSGSLNKEIDAAQTAQDSTNLDLKKLKTTIEAGQSRLDDLNQTIQDEQINLNNAKYELTSAQQKAAKNRQDLDGNLATLRESYQIEQPDLTNPDWNWDEKQVASQIKMLRTGIDEIGPVNIGAIQEFKEVSKRFDFLTKQKQDLLDAKDHLTSTMRDMDSTISNKFATAFNQVSKAFSKVFVDMFGGGEAKLVLTDPDDMLDTGIEIMVKPPGKNYRNLSLLSGGEKALTAITLLFAIIKVRPVPFCILDEAEAALDPFNADRFAKYLKRFGDETQFVVITHRKETMIYADQLYGVTMQESGVSKVVTVNLDNLKTEVS